MPTERMEEVEVVSHLTGDTIWLAVAPGTVTEARLRLADAAEAWFGGVKMLGPERDEFDAAFKSLAALRTARGA